MNQSEIQEAAEKYGLKIQKAAQAPGHEKQAEMRGKDRRIGFEEGANFYASSIQKDLEAIKRDVQAIYNLAEHSAMAEVRAKLALETLNKLIQK